MTLKERMSLLFWKGSNPLRPTGGKTLAQGPTAGPRWDTARSLSTQPNPKEISFGLTKWRRQRQHSLSSHGLGRWKKRSARHPIFQGPRHQSPKEADSSSSFFTPHEIQGPHPVASPFLPTHPPPPHAFHFHPHPTPSSPSSSQAYTLSAHLPASSPCRPSMPGINPLVPGWTTGPFESSSLSQWT